MTLAPALLPITLLLLASAAHAYRLLPGPMPQLTAPAEPDRPAPVPDRDAAPPPPATPPGARVAPALIDRRGEGEPSGSGYTPGSVYSPGLERRHGDSGGNLGTVLAPGLQLRVPLK